MEKLSLGENTKGRLLGRFLRRVGVVVATIWIAVGLVLRLDLLLLVITALIYVLVVEGMRSFLLGKDMWMEFSAAPAEPGWIGRRIVLFIAFVFLSGLIMYVMVVEVIQRVQ